MRKYGWGSGPSLQDPHSRNLYKYSLIQIFGREAKFLKNDPAIEVSLVLKNRTSDNRDMAQIIQTGLTRIWPRNWAWARSQEIRLRLARDDGPDHSDGLWPFSFTISGKGCQRRYCLNCPREREQDVRKMAGSDSQKQLLTLIRDYATEKSHGGDLLFISIFLTYFLFLWLEMYTVVVIHSGDAQKNAE